MFHRIPWLLGTSGGEGRSRASCQRSLVCGNGPSDGGSGWAGLIAMQPAAFALRLHKVHEGSAPHCLSVSAPTHPSDVGPYGSVLVCEQPVLGCRRPQSYTHDVRRQHHDLSFRGRPLPALQRPVCDRQSDGNGVFRKSLCMAQLPAGQLGTENVCPQLLSVFTLSAIPHLASATCARM